MSRVYANHFILVSMLQFLFVIRQLIAWLPAILLDSPILHVWLDQTACYFSCQTLVTVCVGDFKVSDGQIPSCQTVPIDILSVCQPMSNVYSPLDSSKVSPNIKCFERSLTTLLRNIYYNVLASCILL